MDAKAATTEVILTLSCSTWRLFNSSSTLRSKLNTSSVILVLMLASSSFAARIEASIAAWAAPNFSSVVLLTFSIPNCSCCRASVRVASRSSVLLFMFSVIRRSFRSRAWASASRALVPCAICVANRSDSTAWSRNVRRNHSVKITLI